MPRPRFSKLETRKQDLILDAAAHEFGELGFERASYNRIIEQAGLSKGAMYYYFDDKQDLFVTVIDRVVHTVQEHFGEPIGGDTPGAYWSSVQRACRRLARLFQENRRVAAVIPLLLDGWRRPGDRDVVRTFDGRLERWVVQAIERGQRVGAIRQDLPVGLLRCLLLAMLEATYAWMRRETPADIHPELFTRVLGVLGAPGGTVDMTVVEAVAHVPSDEPHASCSVPNGALRTSGSTCT